MLEKIISYLTLPNLTYLAILLVVLALVVYLLGIIIALNKGNNSLKELAGGLDQVVNNTKPLTKKLETINGALSELLNGLVAVDGHLAGMAKLLRK